MQKEVFVMSVERGGGAGRFIFLPRIPLFGAFFSGGEGSGEGVRYR